MVGRTRWLPCWSLDTTIPTFPLDLRCKPDPVLGISGHKLSIHSGNIHRAMSGDQTLPRYPQHGGLESLRPVEKIYLSTLCGNPGGGTATIPLACPRGPDDAPSHAQRATDAPQGDSSTGKFAHDPLPDTTTSSPPSILIVAGQARDLPIRGAPVVRRPD